MDDENLVSHSREGNKEAFEELVRRYYGAIFNKVYQKIRQWEDAEEITQDVFTSVWLNIKHYKAGNFAAWLYKIAYNCCSIFIRKSKALKRQVKYELLHENIPDGRTRQPLEELLKKESLISSQYTEQEQKIIGLWSEGRTQKEIAEILDISLSTVKRARKEIMRKSGRKQ